MAEGKIDLEIVTPKGKALSVSADEVTAPSVQGEFGVLPGHLPIVAALRTGIVTYRQGNEQKKVAVGSGFAEAGHNKVLILAEEYTVRDNVNPVEVHKELADVQAKIEKLAAQIETSADQESEKKHLIDKENWLAVQLELYGEQPPATMRPHEEWGPPPPPPQSVDDESATSN